MTRSRWTRWDLESVREEALKYDKRSAFCRNSIGAYTWARRNGRLDEVCGHMPPLPRRWDFESVRAEARKYNKRRDFQRECAGAHAWARVNGCLKAVCAHMPSLRRDDWDLESVRTEALKYKTRIAFYNGSRGAYKWAHRRGVIDKICSHTERAWQQWDAETVRQDALQYSNRNDFRLRSIGAYMWATRHDTLDEVCAHMTPGPYVPGDRDAIYLWQVIGAEHNGLPVFKIGMTSARLGVQRVEQVARRAGFDAELLALAPVPEAPILERLLLELGAHAPVTDSDGYTEFRALNRDELELALEFIQAETATRKCQRSLQSAAGWAIKVA